MNPKIESFKNNIEQLNEENEQKYSLPIADCIDKLADFPIEDIQQLYLSSPSDDFSLRLRQSTMDGNIEYSAALKSRGTIQDAALLRTEIETPISAEAFVHYQQLGQYAELHKQRYHLAPGVIVDHIDGYPQLLGEVEEPSHDISALHLLSNDLQPCPELTNEQIAYEVSEMSPEPSEDIPAELIADELVAHLRCGKQRAVVTIAGMSGSGKSTKAREVAGVLSARYPHLPTPVVISTDNYHVGKTYLEATYRQPWTNWDDARVYDTARLADDIRTLIGGEPITDYRFDFSTEETIRTGELQPSPFIILEGVHGGSPDLNAIRDVHFDLPTSPATSISRDVVRLVGRTNESIGSPEDRLHYMLETGLPTYQALERPQRKAFSASVRPIGDAALRWLVKET